jgi:hypothetical protein
VLDTIKTASGIAAPYFGSAIALGIAIVGIVRDNRKRAEDRRVTRVTQVADKLIELLRLYIADPYDGIDVQKAVLLTLPGDLATILRIKLGLTYTVKDVPLSSADRARLRADETDAGHKWLIFARASVGDQSLDRYAPRSEWVEAELRYDIAALLGGDQDAVLADLGRHTQQHLDDQRAAQGGMFGQLFRQEKKQ